MSKVSIVKELINNLSLCLPERAVNQILQLILAIYTKNTLKLLNQGGIQIR